MLAIETSVSRQLLRLEYQENIKPVNEATHLRYPAPKYSMPRNSVARAGQVLDNRYHLTEEIGHGGMSVVFKARDLQNGDEAVAVKVPLPMFASGLGAWSMFQQEEAIGLRLNHPLVLKFVPNSAKTQRSYLVTEFVPGRTLDERLREQSPLPESEALALASQICEALQYIHEQGYVHYDLKPANIILCPDGTIRLIDLGTAHAAEMNGFTLSGAPPQIGTPDYVAPEQIKRKRGRKSADVYGTGAMLYEMLTGQPPFPGDDPFQLASNRLLGDPVAPRAINPAISPEAEEIVLRAVRRKPSERYSSVAVFKAALDHPDRVAMSNLCEQLQPVTRFKRFNRITRHIALVVLIPVASQVLLFLWLWHHYSH
jgi:serine/threonine-protein kinase